jgi:arginine:ornithine antiporter/lysine permease
MLATVFVFLGVEGASVYSRLARRREDVGRATILGFVSVLAVFASVTIVSYGILPGPSSPSCANRRWRACWRRRWAAGARCSSASGLIVSVLGAYLAWTLMAAEVLFVAAQDDDMPRFLRRENQAQAPVAAC